MSIVTILIILGVSFILFEFFVGDFTFTFLGISTIISAILTIIFGFTLAVALVVAIIIFVILFIWLRPYIIKWLYKNTVKSNIDEIEGQSYKVFNIDKEDNTRANVKIYDDIWTVKANAPLKKGDIVKIKKVKGNILPAEKIIEDNKESK